MIEALKKRIAKLRRILYLVDQLSFEIEYLKASPEDQQLIRGFIESEQEEKVRKWISEKENESLETMSARKLRDKASRLGIQYVNDYCKTTLITKIREILKDEEGRTPEGDRSEAEIL